MWPSRPARASAPSPGKRTQRLKTQQGPRRFSAPKPGWGLPAPSGNGILRAMSPPWPWPARPHLRVVLLVLHAQEGADFFGDTRMAQSGGELQAAGVAAELVHVHYRRGDEPHNQRLDAEVLALVDAETLVVVDQAWREGLLQALQARGALLVATDAAAVWQSLQVDALVEHYATHREPLRQLALAVRAGRAAGPLINAALRPGAGQHLQPWGPSQAYPDEPEALRPFAPLTTARVIGTPRNLDGRPLPRRRTLEVSSGCPFADKAADNPQFADVAMPAGVAAAGCSFCFMGGDYRNLPVAETVRLQVEQLRYWQDHGAGLQEAVLRDQSALRYLPQLVQACQRAGLAPLGLLVPGRGDAILRWGKELRHAAALCEGTGWWFTIHLIGFESFSQRQLDLYNKGVTVQDYAQALQQMRALHREFPNGFQPYAYGASSFILFNPWTELADLHATAAFCDAHAVGALARGLTLSRLRLYPNLPLYWKAKHDGLLDEQADASRGAAFAGYSREAGWRYRDGRVALVELLQARLAPRVKPDHSVGLLRAVLAWAEQRWPEPLPLGVAPAEALEEIEAIAEQLDRLRQLWRRQGPLAIDAAAAQARTLAAGRSCNNRCLTCVAHHAELEERPEPLARQIAQAAGGGSLVLGGREPALWPELLQHLRRARQQGATDIELLSNARFLAAPGAATRLMQAGVTRLTVKRHRLADADEDAFAQSSAAGAHGTQGLQAATALQRQRGGWRVAVLLLPVRTAWHELPALVDWAGDCGAREVRVEVLAGELPLGDLANAAALLQRAAARAAERRLHWSVDGC